MDNRLINKTVRCPYCGETMDLVIDLSAGSQSYVEDCHICCQPMQIDFETDDGQLLAIRVDRAG